MACDKGEYHCRESMVGHSCSPMAARTGKGGGQGQYLLQEYAHGDLLPTGPHLIKFIPS